MIHRAAYSAGGEAHAVLCAGKRDECSSCARSWGLVGVCAHDWYSVSWTVLHARKSADHRWVGSFLGAVC